MTMPLQDEEAGPATWWVVMGVSGCGKSSVGKALAQALGLPFIEGDDFHPQANIEKMRNGIALDDGDRAGWLAILAEALAAKPGGAVLACSALKRAYRDTLRSSVPALRFVFLQLTLPQALARAQARGPAHFFSPSLVDSQFATLQDPTGEPGVLPLPATAPVAELVRRITAWQPSPADRPQGVPR